MNSAQQKNHRTVTAELASHMETLTNVAATRFTSHETALEVLRTAVNDERTHRLKLADEQRGYVDARDRELRECCQERWDATAQTTMRLADAIRELRGRGFWARWNWLVTGR